MTTTLAAAKKRHLRAFMNSVRQGGGFCPAEADDVLNDTNRELIAAMKEHHGTCWLGKINLYKEDDRGCVIWEWDGELVYNWGASFVVPAFDEELRRLIIFRDAVPYVGTANDYEWVKAIHDRIEELGGHHFVWS